VSDFVHGDKYFDLTSIFAQHRIHGLLKSSRREGGGMPQWETSSVDGGFSIRRYGASINSIQFEIADTIRLVDRNRQFLIEDLASAIINFVRRHATF
jgi:hypothetical protein